MENSRTCEGIQMDCFIPVAAPSHSPRHHPTQSQDRTATLDHLVHHAPTSTEMDPHRLNSATRPFDLAGPVSHRNTLMILALIDSRIIAANPVTWRHHMTPVSLDKTMARIAIQDSHSQRRIMTRTRFLVKVTTTVLGIRPSILRTHLESPFNKSTPVAVPSSPRLNPHPATRIRSSGTLIWAILETLSQRHTIRPTRRIHSELRRTFRIRLKPRRSTL